GLLGRGGGGEGDRERLGAAGGGGGEEGDRERLGAAGEVAGRTREIRGCWEGRGRGDVRDTENAQWRGSSTA
ncbi:hypothetical protein RRG08_007489, partial [Elysia crispata]